MSARRPNPRMLCGSLVLLLAWLAAAPVQADQYQSAATPDGSLRLACEGSTVLGAPCTLALVDAAGAASPLPKPLRFGPAPQAHVLRLVRIAAADALAGRAVVALEPQDAAIVAAVDWSQCHADSDPVFGDLFSLCLPPAPHSGQAVLLFLRGVCDSCRFEPVVLRQTKTP